MLVISKPKAYRHRGQIIIPATDKPPLGAELSRPDTVISRRSLIVGAAAAGTTAVLPPLRAGAFVNLVLGLISVLDWIDNIAGRVEQAAIFIRNAVGTLRNALDMLLWDQPDADGAALIDAVDGRVDEGEIEQVPVGLVRGRITEGHGLDYRRATAETLHDFRQREEITVSPEYRVLHPVVNRAPLADRQRLRESGFIPGVMVRTGLDSKNLPTSENLTT